MPKYMLLQTYAQGEDCDIPLPEWAPEDIRAHIQFQHVLNAELSEAGELVEAEGLAGPEAAKTVVADGKGGAVVTDGPFPEGKELLAGYRVVDVESEARALEIATRVSAAPGPEGAPLRVPIEVRQVMSAPEV
ncbi:YciI family protein [Amycolatopsis sp. NPDC003676]